jgi:DNA-binding MarR family transcriptional regulator
MRTVMTTCIDIPHSSPPAARVATEEAGAHQGLEAARGPVLYAHEREAWNALRAVLLSFPRNLSAHLQGVIGLSHFEFEILETLERSTRSTRRLGDLAAACHSSLSTLSRAVSRLESRELVTRRMDPVNGRYVVCQLTETGSDILHAGLPEHIAQLRRLIFDALADDQISQLTDICTVLGETLSAEPTNECRGRSR